MPATLASIGVPCGLHGQSAAAAADAFSPAAPLSTISDDPCPAESPVQSSLDPPESTSHPSDHIYIGFRHSFASRPRAAIWAQMERFHTWADPPPSPRTFSHRALERFRSCGQRSFVLRSRDDPPSYKLVSATCRNRFCHACQADRGRLIAANLREKLPATQLRFLTLTVKAEGLALSAALDHLYTSFAKLRRMAIFKRHVSGGLAVLEVTWSPVSGRWHPHFHCLLQGDFFPQSQLKAAWQRATGDSYIVHIKPAGDTAGIAGYLTKYLTKSLSKGVWSDPPRLAEAMSALHGRKLLIAFGAWHRLRLLEPPLDDRSWDTYSAAGELLSRVLAGNIDALEIALRLWGQQLVAWLKLPAQSARASPTLPCPF